MTQATINNKILSLQAQVQLLSKSLAKDIDFEADERVWRKLRGTAKKVRKEIFKKTYGR